MALIGEMQYLTTGGNTYSIPTSGGSTISITRSLTSGTKTAAITVDGTTYDLYAPTPNAGTITSITTTAGSHTTINTTSGAVSFNVPTKTSHLTNDSGFLTSYTETDPTVPDWAKASTKPSYTAAEVGALVDDTTYVSTITTSAGTHSTISSKSGAVSFNVPTNDYAEAAKILMGVEE